VLNVHAPTENKIDDMKDRFYEELEQVFDKFVCLSVQLVIMFTAIYFSMRHEEVRLSIVLRFRVRSEV
jgi:hypothetical protein